jgi:glucoamylase
MPSCSACTNDAGATRLVDYLWRVQEPDGSWWQNTRVDGTPHWTTEQLDETALPIVLAWWLGRTGAADWAHVEPAADYIAANGPDTGQERWENQNGWSPNTIATEIAGLICAADIARRNGAPGKAEAYERLADQWQAQVESWTATTNGPYSPDPYYLRVTKDADPDDGSTYSLGDNFPRPVDEREIVDNSFLGLVLFGVKPWDDPVVRNSLSVGDTQLVSDTPSFAVLAIVRRCTDASPPSPEQAWDGRPPHDEPAGEGTRSATPLAWTHAQFVRLAWSIDAGTPIERPAIVACRYTGAEC